MTDETIADLRARFAESPILRAESLPTSEEIELASLEIGVPFSTDYRDFLRMFGAAMVGPYPIFGLRPVEVMGVDEWSVIEMTRRYRTDGVPGTQNWVVFSEDHAGNPVGMNTEGEVWIHDHDFGGLTQLAFDFEAYLLTWCLNLDS